MLSEFTTEKQLKEALEKCKDFPNYLILHQCIRHALEQSAVSVTSRVFVHKDSSGRELHIVLQSTFNRISIILCCLPSAAFEGHSLDDVFDYIHEVVQSWYIPRYAIGVYGIDSLVQPFFTWLSKRQVGVEVDDTPCSLFYMTSEQMERVNSLKTALPDGYSLVKLEPDKHAAFISSKWKFAQADETERTKAKLRYVPTYGVQFDATGELASFALNDDDDTYGSLHHLHTVPEHRRKGLSKVVEIECCKSCIGHGLVPYKFVEHSNELAPETSRRSAIWTEWSTDDGGQPKPITVTFARYML